jgi:WD40 repeat protein
MTSKALFAIDPFKTNQPPVRLLEGRDLKSLAVAGNDTVAVADFGRSQILLRSATNQTEIHLPIAPLSLAFSSDGHWLACGSDQNDNLYVCDANQPKVPPVRLEHAGSDAVFSADGRRLFTFGREVRVWNVGDWRLEPSLLAETGSGDQFNGAVSRDGRWLAATQNNREVYLVELATGKTVAKLDGPGEGDILALAFSPDGHALVAARDRGDLQVWTLNALRTELTKLHLDW